MNLAPIILFVYNRPLHTEQTLEALMENIESKDSILYVFADGQKPDATKEEIKQIELTREIATKKNWCKEVKLITSNKNKGLAESVISGTKKIVEQYGNVITLEDDVIVGRNFLKYMNDALNKYKDYANVYMISGYNFPIPNISRNHSSYFLPVATSQAWGTWDRVWKRLDTTANGYVKLKYSKKIRSKFNLDNSYDFSSLLIAQMETTNVSSWAVRFYWTLFINKGLILFPDKSLVMNIGWDNSGRHCGGVNPYEEKDWEENYIITTFPGIAKTDTKKFQKLKKYLKFTILFKNKREPFVITKEKLFSLVWKLKNFLSKRFKIPLYRIGSSLNNKIFKSKEEANFQENKIKNEEIARLNSLPRFVETETIFLDRKLKIVDNASFLFIKKELFDLEIYKFKCETETPYILDCGANIGLSIIYFKQLFPKADIVGFEPDDKVFEALKFNIDSFQLKNVTIIKKACWNEETSLKFYSEGADGGRASIDSDTGNIIEVQTVRLRKFLKKKVDFLKIDIEGAETNVLEDCKDLLINVDNIFVEFHSFIGKEQLLPEILRIIKDAGFRIHISSPGLVSLNPFIKLNTYANMDNQLNIYGFRSGN